jgi:N-acetylglucosaminyldiphosphoundecaprenol N-acetyl-beta-D-mannosaminyltransferase
LATEVLTIPLYDRPFAHAVDEIVGSCINGGAKANCLISATSAHGLVIAQRDRLFAELLKRFHLNLPDGMPAVWVGKMKGSRTIERCYGPDLFKQVMLKTADKPVRHYLCGGKEGVALRLKEACANKFGNRNCAGTFSPPFRQMTVGEFRRLGDEINQKDVDIVWIGLSTPKQEFFANELAKHAKAHFIITVGEAFDFHIGAVKEAPSSLQKMGLEWFYRLLMEPRRLYKRYLEIVPLFIYYNLKDLAKRL